MKTNRIFKTLCALTVVAFAFINSAKAQVPKDEIALFQTIWGMEKANIISQYMKFSEGEVAKFGPLYDKYTDEYRKLGAERIQIMSEYANNYTSMTNEKADELTKRYLKNNTAIDKLQLKYYNKMKKEVSALRAAEFMQLEIYLQTMMRAELQSMMPMIAELDKNVK